MVIHSTLQRSLDTIVYNLLTTFKTHPSLRFLPDDRINDESALVHVKVRHRNWKQMINKIYVAIWRPGLQSSFKSRTYFGWYAATVR